MGSPEKGIAVHQDFKKWIGCYFCNTPYHYETPILDDFLGLCATISLLEKGNYFNGTACVYTNIIQHVQVLWKKDDVGWWWEKEKLTDGRLVISITQKGYYQDLGFFGTANSRLLHWQSVFTLLPLVTTTGTLSLWAWGSPSVTVSLKEHFSLCSTGNDAFFMCDMIGAESL